MGGQNIPEDDSDTVRSITHVFQDKFDAFWEEVLTIINKKDEKINYLEMQNSTLNRTVQDRLDDIDAAQRQDEFVVSGSALND